MLSRAAHRSCVTMATENCDVEKARKARTAVFLTAVTVYSRDDDQGINVPSYRD